MDSVLSCHNVAKHTEFYLGYVRFNVTFTDNVGCFKKSFTNLKASMNLFTGYGQCFELSYCSKMHRGLPGIISVQCDFNW
jgi:hypothetical protein